MTRQELTEALLEKGKAAGFDAVAIGAKRNPLLWRRPDGAIECVFNIQGRDIALAEDDGHIRAAVKRFSGFPDAHRRALALFSQNPDGSEKPDGLQSVAGWIKSNIKGGSGRIEVWAEIHKRYA